MKRKKSMTNQRRRKKESGRERQKKSGCGRMLVVKAMSDLFKLSTLAFVTSSSKIV